MPNQYNVCSSQRYADATVQFSPVVILDHTDVIQLSTGQVWHEQVSATSERKYKLITHPFSPPTVSSTLNDPGGKMGISQMAFSLTGDYFATKEVSVPTTVWVWDLAKLTPRAIFIHHAPVKHFSWHPTVPDLLLIQCAQEHPIVYLWGATEDPPQILHVPLHRGSGRFESRWLDSTPGGQVAFMFGDSTQSLLVWPHGRGDIAPNTSNGVAVDDDTEDSLFDILTGRIPLPLTQNDTLSTGLDLTDDSIEIEDTFREQKK